MCVDVGSLRLDNPVILAPMSGVTDAPFRRLARRWGAGLVVSEMIVSRGVIQRTRESERRRQPDGAEGPLVIQLAGAEPEPMALAARLSEDRGARMIDINMGCPVKKVAQGKQAGAALMRDEALAARLIEATVGAVSVPVGLKMRTGWDATRRNAPRLAKLAEDLGVSLITVHGRTREQGFGGRADWDFIARVKDAVAVPVIANGDVETYDDARGILRQSKADGVMIGRGACGRPWFPGAVARYLATGHRPPEPTLTEQKDVALDHYRDLLAHHGTEIGRRVARKHLGWYLDKAGAGEATRRRVQQEDDPARVICLVAEAYDRLAERRAA
ncbi:MAG: tRNA dihydrouridine synthase DusB [Alphaproteobacteria bacterium]|jgi:tRNA-dihydrouridine synthase B|nr:tRNA dihydrouridine synthase DusB [Alphaproteobacteria bacterium]